MSLRLSPELAAEYIWRCEANKTKGLSVGTAAAMKRARQLNGALYDEYQRKQLAMPIEDQEKQMSIEDRINRIEETLKLGRFAE